MKIASIDVQSSTPTATAFRMDAAMSMTAKNVFQQLYAAEPENARIPASFNIRGDLIIFSGHDFPEGFVDRISQLLAKTVETAEQLKKLELEKKQHEENLLLEKLRVIGEKQKIALT